MSTKLYYVAHAKDNYLKPLTPELFDLFTASPDNCAKAMAFRRGAAKEASKNLMHLFYYQGTLNREKYDAHVADCKARGVKPEGSRKVEFMLPTTWLMIDLDHEETPLALWAEMKVRLEDKSLLDHLIIAHLTPSGKGLRLVVDRLPEMMDMEMEAAKGAWLELIAPGRTSDSACRDFARGSFCPLKAEILHVNRERLFSPQLLPVSMERGRAPQVHTPPFPAPVIPANGQARTFPDHYEGTPYKQILERLIPQLDGSVNEGGRHHLIMGLAVNLRYICDNNPEWLAQIIPTYGISETEFHRLLADMCAQPRYPYLPRKLRNAIEGMEVTTAPLWFMPRLPEALPPLISLLVSRTPERMQAAVAMAVFPSLGVHLCGVTFKYADNKTYDPAFMSLLIAPQASGKSAVDMPIELIMADILEVDQRNRGVENEWREKVANMGSNKEKPRRPQNLCIQQLSPNTTNAAFVKRLKEAGGRTLYVKINELEQLRGLAGISGGENELIKITYDRALYGQERVGIDSVNEQAILRLNWNASTTPVMAQDFFSHNALVDGTLSRITCCTIPVDEDDWGEEIPTFGTYDDAFTQQLSPFVETLNSARGVYTCPESIEWARTMQRLMIQHAKELNNKVMADYARRAVRSGFYRAMLLYVVGGCEWTSEIEAFATWSVEYDLWVKWNVYEAQFAKANDQRGVMVQKSGNSLLRRLPTEFTKEMLQEQRPEGEQQKVDTLLRHWKFRGQVIYDENRKVYIKQCQEIKNLSA